MTRIWACDSDLPSQQVWGWISRFPAVSCPKNLLACPICPNPPHTSEENSAPAFLIYYYNTFFMFFYYLDRFFLCQYESRYICNNISRASIHINICKGIYQGQTIRWIGGSFQAIQKKLPCFRSQLNSDSSPFAPSTLQCTVHRGCFLLVPTKKYGKTC